MASVAPSRIDKSNFYAAMASGKAEEVDAMLNELEKSSLPEKEAYTGALTMRKAGLTSKIKEKLDLFKSGRAKLEAAIKNDEGNVEYHFLRLIIQENAPKIVKYRSDLKTDAEMVNNSFKKLSPELRDVIKDYSKKSKFLKQTDL